MPSAKATKGDFPMALSSFARGSASKDVSGNSSPAPSSSPGGMTAFIDQGSQFEGKLSFQHSVRIDGVFRGEIVSEATLVVGESGEIQASIHSCTVVMSGKLEGDIVATDKVVLHKTARVRGNIQTPKLVIEEGALLDGAVKMESPGAKPAGGSLKAIDGGRGPESEPPPSKKLQ